MAPTTTPDLRNGIKPASLALVTVVAMGLGGCSGFGGSSDEDVPETGTSGAVDAGAACGPDDYTRRCWPDFYDNPFGVFACQDENDAGPSDPCAESLAFWSEGDAGVCPEATDEV